MTFQTTSNHLILFAWFLSLGVKYGVEQKVFNLIKCLLTNKIVKVLSAILNVIVVMINCAQFYFLALRLNFGEIRAFMFLSFFLGIFIVFALSDIFLRIKNLKKSKKKTN